MAKGRGDFTDILVRKKVLSPEQLDEAINLDSNTDDDVDLDAITSDNEYPSPPFFLSFFLSFLGSFFLSLVI